MSQGKLFVISGPSGVGKGTLMARLLKQLPDTWLSVSATSRKARPGEIDGVSYLFLTREEFEKRIKENDFFEWAQYNENYYGTPKSPVFSQMSLGKPAILEIEVQGAMQVREQYPEAILIFIEPPSIEDLRQRLNERGTESAKVIEQRIAAAEDELQYRHLYDWCLVNDDLDKATKSLVDFIKQRNSE